MRDKAKRTRALGAGGSPVTVARLVVALIFAAATAAISSAQETPSNTRARRTIAVTIDDLPAKGDLKAMQDTTAKLLRTLVAERVPAIGFVNENKLFAAGEVEARTALLEDWLEAGLDLGNHTYSHPSIDSVPFETYKADVIKGEAVTKRLLEARGRRLRYFRHPQLRTGPTLDYKAAVDGLLSERGYRTAPVTIDNMDFMFADVYRRARERADNDAMARVTAAYLPYMESVIAHFEELSREFLGYELPQVLLLHANALNAHHLKDLIGMLRERGYRFVTLDEALEDPAYRLPDGVHAKGLSWLHRWMSAEGLAVVPEPAEPSFIRELFRTY